MSLRDDIAIVVLQKFPAPINPVAGGGRNFQTTWGQYPPEDIANACYRIADAMLARRDAAPQVPAMVTSGDEKTECGATPNVCQPAQQSSVSNDSNPASAAPVIVHSRMCPECRENHSRSYADICNWPDCPLDSTSGWDKAKKGPDIKLESKVVRFWADQGINQ